MVLNKIDDALNLFSELLHKDIQTVDEYLKENKRFIARFKLISLQLGRDYVSISLLYILRYGLVYIPDKISGLKTIEYVIKDFRKRINLVIDLLIVIRNFYIVIPNNFIHFDAAKKDRNSFNGELHISIFEILITIHSIDFFDFISIDYLFRKTGLKQKGIVVQRNIIRKLNDIGFIQTILKKDDDQVFFITDSGRNFVSKLISNIQDIELKDNRMFENYFQKIQIHNQINEAGYDKVKGNISSIESHPKLLNKSRLQSDLHFLIGVDNFLKGGKNFSIHSSLKYEIDRNSVEQVLKSINGEVQ